MQSIKSVFSPPLDSGKFDEDFRDRRKLPRFVFLASGIGLIAVVSICFGSYGGKHHNDVYASKTNVIQETDTAEEKDNAGSNLQNSLNGIVEGISAITKSTDTNDSYQIEFSFENIIVGHQQADKDAMQKNAVVQGMRRQAGAMEASAKELLKEVQMSDTDYETLLRIVEAEATGEGVYGKILVANVILNRLADPSFPNTVYDVVWERMEGVPQFAPTADGRIYKISITDETKEAVDRAINGEDYSQGARYFIAKDDMNESDIRWFTDNLDYLFSYKDHDFFIGRD